MLVLHYPSGMARVKSLNRNLCISPSIYDTKLVQARKEALMVVDDKGGLFRRDVSDVTSAITSTMTQNPSMMSCLLTRTVRLPRCMQ